MMDFNFIKNIATIVGIIVSTLTLLSAYNIYRLGKRDSYTKEIRNILITFRYNCNCLNQLINYEIVHELVHNVIYSMQMDRILTKIYTTCFNGAISEDGLHKELEEFAPITTSIHTELLSQYLFTLKNNVQEASKVYTNYPSLYRVYASVNTLFSNVIDVSKQVIRDEDMYKKLIIDIFAHKEEVLSIGDFKELIFYRFMAGVQQGVLKNAKKDVEASLEILKITTNGFMSLPDNGLIKQKKRENDIMYKEMDKTNDIIEDMLEAEKGLRFIFTNDEMLLFRELNTRIKVRHEDNEGE